MRIWFLFVSSLTVLTLAFCSPSQAQDAPHAGQRALLFEIDPNFDLNGFGAATIAYRSHGSARRAMRLSITLSSSVQSADATSTTGDTLGNFVAFGVDRHSGSYNIGVASQWIWYGAPVTSVSVYTAVGPSAGFFSNHSEQRNGMVVGGVLNEDRQENRSTAWEAGALGHLGVEWFVSRNISLLAEYGTSVAYRHTRIVNHLRLSPSGSRRDQEQIERTFLVIPDGVRFGLAASFR